MSKKQKVQLGVLLSILVAVLLVVFFHNKNFAVLNPAGTIAEKQRNLILIATGLMLIVVIPVFVMLALFTWRFRDTNHRKQKYTPEWDGSRLLEVLWWGFPMAIILILGVITWKSSHDLDPFKPIEASSKPLTIQVVALEWKWLFIYPEQNIATVNYLNVPKDTPINLEITADAPMNSLWIPQLGGQIYAMSGMSTNLHLKADRVGTYKGSSANLSGDGFAGMKFDVHAQEQFDFNQWVKQSRQSQTLDAPAYESLAAKSKNNPPATYSAKDDLYTHVLDKYPYAHGASHSSDAASSTMGHGEMH